MRFFEFADAQAQLDLLRVIVDNTWSAIAQQAQQQKQLDDERKKQPKLTARAFKPLKRKPTHEPKKAIPAKTAATTDAVQNMPKTNIKTGTEPNKNSQPKFPSVATAGYAPTPIQSSSPTVDKISAASTV